MTFGPIRRTSGGSRKLGHYEPLGGPAAVPIIQGARYSMANNLSLTSGAFSVVQLDTRFFDRDSALDAGNYAIKLPWYDTTGNGIYEVVCHLTFDSNATGYREMAFQLYDTNSATWNSVETMSVAAVNGDRTDLVYTFLSTLYAAPTAGTLAKVRIQAFQNSGGPLNLAGGSSLAIRYIASTL